MRHGDDDPRQRDELDKSVLAPDVSSLRKALGAPENAAVLPEAARRSGRAMSVRLRRTHSQCQSTSFDPNGAQPRCSPEAPRVFLLTILGTPRTLRVRELPSIAERHGARACR